LAGSRHGGFLATQGWTLLPLLAVGIERNRADHPAARKRKRCYRRLDWTSDPTPRGAHSAGSAKSLILLISGTLWIMMSLKKGPPNLLVTKIALSPKSPCHQNRLVTKIALSPKSPCHQNRLVTKIPCSPIPLSPNPVRQSLTKVP